MEELEEFEEEDEDEEDDEDFDLLSDFVPESLPHAEAPKHMIAAHAVATALRKIVLRIGLTIAAIIDFHGFNRLLQGYRLEWGAL